ncbi:unnamed protein product [Lampetra planeri]
MIAIVVGQLIVDVEIEDAAVVDVVVVAMADALPLKFVAFCVALRVRIAVGIELGAAFEDDVCVVVSLSSTLMPAVSFALAAEAETAANCTTAMTTKQKAE